MLASRQLSGAHKYSVPYRIVYRNPEQLQKPNAFKQSWKAATEKSQLLWDIYIWAIQHQSTVRPGDRDLWPINPQTTAVSDRQRWDPSTSASHRRLVRPPTSWRSRASQATDPTSAHRLTRSAASTSRALVSAAGLHPYLHNGFIVSISLTAVETPT